MSPGAKPVVAANEVGGNAPVQLAVIAHDGIDHNEGLRIAVNERKSKIKLSLAS